MQWLSISFLKKTPWCDAHRRVNLCRVHHTAESSSAVCIPPRSQTAHHRARIKIFESLWLLLKGQSGEIILGVNIIITKEKRTGESKFSNFVIEYLSEIETETGGHIPFKQSYEKMLFKKI